MDSVLAFYSDDPNLNPGGYLNFLYEKTKLNKKETGVGPSKKIIKQPSRLITVLMNLMKNSAFGQNLLWGHL